MHRNDGGPDGRATKGRGFTLIELMVVIVILGLLVGIVGPKVWNMLTKGTKEAAKIQMDALAKTVELYYLENKSLPGGLEELTQVNASTNQPYIDSIPLDPWKQAYDYKVVNAARKEFTISSAGEDKQWGTEDDLVWPPPKDSQ